MRGTGVVSSPCGPGVLEEDVLDDELDELELEPPGACARIAGASAIPPTSNPTAPAASHSRREAIARQRDRTGRKRFKLSTIWLRRSQQV